MNTAVTEMPAPVVFTEAAAGKVAELIAEEGNTELKLRVYVSGGGCSGFQYGFAFDETPTTTTCASSSPASPCSSTP
jgi:iron-sulfur cluster insertion protein